jgi:hypothetical protein
MDDKKVREAAVRLLEEKGYKVTDLSKGQGVPKLSRISIRKDGKESAALIKTSTSGRISFTREQDGHYRFLRDAEYVIHVHPIVNDPTLVQVTMFDRQTVVEAFNANHKALVEHGMEHIPSWVNPEEEKGWRQTGSGFGTKALWSAAVPLVSTATASEMQRGAGGQPLKLTIAQAKEGLAENFGVSPDKIEIIVRG